MGRIPSSEPNKRQVKFLSGLHRMIIMKYALGARVKDIAEEFKVGRETVGRVVHSDLGKAELQRLYDQTEKMGASVSILAPLASMGVRLGPQ